VNDTLNARAAEYDTIRRDDWGDAQRGRAQGSRIVSIPTAPAILDLRSVKWTCDLPLYTCAYMMASNDSFVAIGKAERRLGWAPRLSNRDALLCIFAWYRAYREAFTCESGIGHRLLSRQGALSLAKRVC
jgi:hypothetical protein